MKIHSSYKSFLLIFLVIFLFYVSGCDSKKITESKISSPPAIITGKNHLKNGGFEEWENRDIPSFWKWEASLNNRFIFDKIDFAIEGDRGIRITRWFGKNYIYQKVPVDKNSFYLASVFVSYKNSRWSKPFGLKIYSKNMNTVLGKHYLNKGLKTGYEKILSTKFNSLDNDTIIFMLGIENGLQGVVFFDDARLLKVEEYTILIRDDNKEKLKELIGINNFNPTFFHSNILKISKFVNSQLAETYKEVTYFKGSDNARERLIKTKKSKRIQTSSLLKNFLNDSSSFIKALEKPIKQPIPAYCRTSSLSIADILNIFNIPFREIHFYNEEDHFHQFYDYWNPYDSKWISVDPYYGITYVDVNNLLGFDDLKILVDTKGINFNNVKRVNINEAHYSEKELQKTWKAELMMLIRDDDRITYPH